MRLILNVKFLICWAATVVLLLIQRTTYETVLRENQQTTQSQPDYFWVNRSNLLIRNARSSSEEQMWGGFHGHPFSPFNEDQPKLVVVLSYQRCGSSFFAHLFYKNPEFLYFFEPVDAVYSTMYGTSLGWNIPSDITSFANGTERILPDFESQAVSKLLLDLLTCDLPQLPVELLAHHFHRRAQNDYFRCLNNTTIFTQMKQCFKLAPVSFCGGRFGTVSPERHKECYDIFSNTEVLENHPNRTLFLPFVKCKQMIRQIVITNCGRTFSNVCDRRNLRAVKTVRATMKSMEPLLSAVPNFRLIHLLRDPRPVMLSRKNYDRSGKGLYSYSNKNGFNKSREAEIFCRTVYRDLQTRMKLEKQFPGKIYPVFYEDVMSNLKEYSTKIYSFLNLSSPVESLWFNGNILGINEEKAKFIPTKWKSSLSFKESRAISDICNKLYRIVNKWEK